MRVLLVSGEYPPMKGGVGRYTKNLAQAIAKRPSTEVSVAVGATLLDSANPKPRQDGSNNVRVYGDIIRKGDKTNSDRLLKLISEVKPDIVNIQYERGLYEVDTTIRHTFWRLAHGSTLDRFYRSCPVPTVSTLHTVFPRDEYSSYVKDRALRKEGRFAFLPQRLRSAIRTWVMEQRYELLLQVVHQSDGIISLAKTLQEITNRGKVIYHGAEPAIELSISVSSPMMHKTEFRRSFGLPLEGMLLLAFGYAGSYKGFDVLSNLHLPGGWHLVVKQTKHERGSEKPIEIGNDRQSDITSLNLGYLDDATMSKLFFACDAIIFPYKVVSISGVTFDAIAHGLPFVASDLRFFKEFATMGLGITAKRDIQSFDRALSNLAQDLSEYQRRVELFRTKLQWSNIAKEHIEYFSDLISEHKHDDRIPNKFNSSKHSKGRDKVK